MRLTRKLKQRYIESAKEEFLKLTGVHVAECMFVGVGRVKVNEHMVQRMSIYYRGDDYPGADDEHVNCCVDGDRYFTYFYCDKLPYWMKNPCTDGKKNYPDAALPKAQYDNLKAIAEGKLRIKAVDEWNKLVDEYSRL